MQQLNTEEVNKEALAITEKAMSIKVVDADSYIAAGDLWKTIKKIRQKQQL